MTSKYLSLPLCSLAAICFFVATAIPAEAGRRDTTTDTPPVVVSDPNAPLVSAE